MKILYTTDLHGNKEQFELNFNEAIKNNVKIVINGGDMMPKTDEYTIFKLQEKFLKYLEGYFEKFEKERIYYLCLLGNDDLRIYDKRFDEICKKFEFVKNIAQRKVKIEGYEFIGMNFIVDNPFRLKDRCRKDTDEYQIGIQYGTALVSLDNGFEEIKDWKSYINTLPTLDDELSKLPKPKNKGNTIYVIHMPPSNLGLDVCQNGNKVGSKAVYNFLLKNQPRMSLHGHIHESPEISGVWKANIGDTICIQPGQSGILTYVLIDTSKNKIDLFRQ
ncbi:MAG: metallophosphoesterase [candidate division WOR-3 bacterium]